MAERFEISEVELVRDLEQAAMCGLPPFLDEVVDLYIDDDGIAHAEIPRFFTRPLRLTAPEGFALLAAGTRGDGDAGRGSAGPARPRAREARGGPRRRRDGARPRPAACHRRPDRGRVASARVAITYWSVSSDETTERVITPRAVFTDRGRWYVIADDDRSGEERMFRVDRVAAWTLTGDIDQPRLVEVPNGDAWFDDAPDLPVVRLRVAPSGHWLVERFPVRSVSHEGDELVVELVVASERLAGAGAAPPRARRRRRVAAGVGGRRRASRSRAARRALRDLSRSRSRAVRGEQARQDRGGGIGIREGIVRTDEVDPVPFADRAEPVRQQLARDRVRATVAGCTASSTRGGGHPPRSRPSRGTRGRTARCARRTRAVEPADQLTQDAVQSGGVAQRSAIDAVEALRAHTKQQSSTRPNEARPPVDGSSVLVDHHYADLQDPVPPQRQPGCLDVDDGVPAHGATVGTGCDAVAGASARAGADADRRGHGEAREVALLFVLATPEPVLAVLAGEVLARLLDRTAQAQPACLLLAALARLGSLGLRSEEQPRSTLADRGLLPLFPARQQLDGITFHTSSTKQVVRRI
jgi:proteasome accessory factor C